MSESVLNKAIQENRLIVAHTVSGLVYAGKVLGYDSSTKMLTLEYVNDSTSKKTDIYLPNILSIQETTKEKIDAMRKQKKEGKHA